MQRNIEIPANEHGNILRNTAYPIIVRISLKSQNLILCDDLATLIII